MAAERPQRANAGRNMGKLLEQEMEKDEFYTTAYGGFDEASGDDEYETEDEEEDTVDSDFDFSEKEEDGLEHDEDLEPKAKRRKWIKPIKTVKPSSEKRVKKKQIEIQSSVEPRTFRKSTVDLAKERERHHKLEDKKRKKVITRSGLGKGTERMTQEQLLEEAKLTEIENLASLEAYRLESEKQTYKEKKHTIQGSVIRYNSITMPVLSVTKEEGLDLTTNETYEKYSRNFLIFTDTNSFPNSFFPESCSIRHKRLYCSITGLPAKYIDPLTKIPYATAQAFRMIRNRFVKEKEDKCEARLLQLSNWLEEKRKLKRQSS